MALAYDTKGNTAGSGTININLTLDATVQVLVAGIAAAASDANRAGGAPTWNTTEALTQIGSTITGYKECQAEMWYLLAPTSGAHTLSVPNTGSDVLNVIASAYKGATACVLDQSTSTNAGGAAGANPSCTLNNVPDGSAVVDCLADGYASVPTGNTGGILLYAIDGTAWDDAGQTRAEVHGVVIDQYTRPTGGGSEFFLGDADNHLQVGMSFAGQNKNLKYAQCWLNKATGSPTQNITCKLYNHTGTFGSTGTPTGAAIATSINTISGTNLTTVPTLVTFEFSPYALSVGTNYFIVLETTKNTSNYYGWYGDAIVLGAAGNRAEYFTGSWTASTTNDLSFIICDDTSTATVTLSYTQSSDDVAMIMASFKESASSVWTPGGKVKNII